MKQPKCIELTAEDKGDLIKRIKGNALSSSDQDLITGLIEFNEWLQFNIHEKNISISRLQKVFGNKTEKRGKKKGSKDKDSADDTSNEDTSDDNAAPDADAEDTEPSTEPSNSKNNGRLSHDAYPGALEIPVSAPYKVGEPCPEDCGGTLKSVAPGNVIKITGQSFAQAKKYVIEKLRCNLCDKYFSGQLPSDIIQDKYDSSFKAHLCVYKHYLGVPNYRLEGYQGYLGVPLPDSTQWDKIEEVANDVYPAFKYLEEYAANGYLAHGDDTGVKILSVIKENQEQEKKTRRGTFTTGIVAYNQGKPVHLFYSGRQHTGENIKELLDKREPGSPKILYMCDALGSNMPKDLKAIVINCLVHGRRNFVEIEKFFPEECSYILDVFSIIYKNEQEAVELGLDANERLAYHREHTRPHVKALYQWIQQQFADNQIEENGYLGKACKYMLRNVSRLTKFLRIPGAPLDNNVVERALKLAIRIRKNSLFYATEHGAFIGGMLQSLIYTCIAAKQNPVAYLIALQDHKEEVRSNPEVWMPWNYLDTMAMSQALAA